ncbi:DinB family protein [Rhodocytophaga rosea]|uniref:DinB family protein n=1 Tax=Rhodocytophaga rosea TaxID=2704465 RepID=A0A6C0GVB5_9BACT|nr:DinB family protein [Rhodocytophaga rosea]QHT71503.1 DinB family protein [Rhodocytophaga rosea]
MNDKVLRKQLVSLLEGENAHISFEKAVADLPAHLRGVKPANLPYSIWQLIEHIRITQWDILEFSTNASHQSPNWPDQYWPSKDGPASEQVWQASLSQIKKDKQAFIALLNDTGKDLFEAFSYGEGQNLLREALLIADHTSYHTGQIIIARRLLGNWQS